MRLRVLALGAMSWCACSVGSGTGSIRGELRDPHCGLDLSDYDLAPTFFGAEYTQNRGDPTAAILVAIRVQRGGARELDSDGIRLLVLDAAAVRATLGEPLIVRPDHDSLLQATFYYGETCPGGAPDDYHSVPALLEAVSGTVTFHALHVPGDASGAISATIDELTFASPDGTRSGVLQGDFEFAYQRGRPAQPFP